jgi:hypothetical protein
MTADNLKVAGLSAVITLRCALSRLRFADRRYSGKLH